MSETWDDARGMSGGGGTICVVMARPVLALLDRRGVAAEPVLRCAQISRDALANIENRLPEANMRALWAEAAAATGDGWFGLHAAQIVPLGMGDVVEYIFATSASLGDGLARVEKYDRLLRDPPNLRLVVEPLEARVVIDDAVAIPQLDEFAIALVLLRARQATGTTWAPERVAFRHHHAGNDGEMARAFGCPVAFGAPHDELVLARALLDLPFARHDSRLLAILERYADSLLERRPRGRTIVARASHAIAMTMRRALPDLESTAAALATTPRTLQRQLADAGTSHSKLVDEVRRGLALAHIGDASLSITEIGYMLHFSDTTAFDRAFKRWTRQTPRRYRERVLFGGSGQLARAE